MQQSVKCGMCGQLIPLHSSYVVKIEVYAHPATPPLDTDTNPDPGIEMIRLLNELKHYSADELQDQVYRKLDYHLCRHCHAIYLSNPLGLPRKDSPSRN